MHRLEQLAQAAEIQLDSAPSAVLLNGEDVTEAIRTPEVGAAASQVAAIPAVRRALVEKQRALGGPAECGDGRPRHRNGRVSRSHV